MPERLIRQFWCPDCKGQMQIVIDGQHARSPGEGELVVFYYFGHCVKCHRPGLVGDVETGPSPWDREPIPQVYPAARTVDAVLPPKVDESFREAMQCEVAGAHLATAVMVRRTLEAIGREFAPEARPLFRALHAMKDKGLISDELAQWGDALRFIGNIGAHPTDDVVAPLDAREALDFLVAIVETIYVLRPKFQAMKARREKQKAAAEPVDDPPASDGSA
jgi:hypothetical protein